ncbi:MAG: NAD(P)-dependent oxidoreductase [Candidatus Omnitrophota bacterium]
MRKKQTIVLTGATGFVGSAVLKQIIKDGNNPIILTRTISNLDRIKDIKGYRSFTYETLKNKNLVAAIKAYKPRTLIHLAWHGVAGDDRNQLFQVTDNIPLTQSTVKFAHEVGCSQWVGIGSRSEYGDPNRKTDELFPTNPVTVYGKVKLACCWSGLGLCQFYGMIGSWLRLFGIYGPGQDPNWLIPYVIREMFKGKPPSLTKCKQSADYVYIDDAAKGILSVAYYQTPGIFNLGSGKATQLKKIVERLRKLINPRLQPNYGAIEYNTHQAMYAQADIRKIKCASGWIPVVELNEGIEKTVYWFKAS